VRQLWAKLSSIGEWHESSETCLPWMPWIAVNIWTIYGSVCKTSSFIYLNIRKTIPITESLAKRRLSLSDQCLARNNSSFLSLSCIAFFAYLFIHFNLLYNKRWIAGPSVSPTMDRQSLYSNSSAKKVVPIRNTAVIPVNITQFSNFLTDGHSLWIILTIN
jgi:hypothetical protein